MSTRTRTADRVGLGTAPVDLTRIVALAGVGMLMAAYFGLLYYFIDVTGQPSTFVLETALTLGAATLLSRFLRVRTALLVGVALLGAGLSVYVTSLPRQPPIFPLMTDAIALMTGRSMLQVTNVDLWVLGVAPGPLFLTWYLALRRRYVSSTVVGGGTLMFLVLTGDAGGITTMLGVVGAAIAVGAGDVERRGDSLAAAEPLAVLLAAMILLSGIATVVPGGPSRTASGLSNFQQDGSGGAGTVEASLVNAGNEIAVQGNISLSPKVRFRVQSSESQYWRIGSFDRFTGGRWIRTGGSRGYGGGRLAGPPALSRAVTQEVTALDGLSVMPAAWKPVRADGAVAGDLRITQEEGLAFTGSLSENESYTVTSQVVSVGPRTLENAGRDYPEEIRERYTKIPASTPGRVAERTARITANAENAYETAEVVEQWLENNREYSLDVERPDGNVADAFLFEMDAGYCTYYATTMVTMLRTQDIPARFVVGYTPGERVDRDEWVVRGYNAHAWVEVYFPDVGWVRFDPTPAQPRRAAEQEELAQAREQNVTGVDTNETLGPEWTPTPTATPAPLTPRQEQPVGGTPISPTPNVRRFTPPGGIITGTVGLVNGTETTGGGAESGGSGGLFEGMEPPSREESALGAVVLLGLVVGLRRFGVTGRIYRALWLRYQPRSDPSTDAQRAFDRLEYLLAERYRPREPGETTRQYLAAIGADERATRVAQVRERARYAGDVSREEADEAVSLVDDIVAG